METIKPMTLSTCCSAPVFTSKSGNSYCNDCHEACGVCVSKKMLVLEKPIIGSPINTKKVIDVLVYGADHKYFADI